VHHVLVEFIVVNENVVRQEGPAAFTGVTKLKIDFLIRRLTPTLFVGPLLRFRPQLLLPKTEHKTIYRFKPMCFVLSVNSLTDDDILSGFKPMSATKT
jgi:hypothetical protein